MASVATRLKELRGRAEPRLTVRALADLLEMPYSSYAFYEDAKKYKKPILPFDLTKRIATILDDRGVPAAEVMQLAGLQSSAAAGAKVEPQSEILTVKGAVAAGIWLEQTDWPPEDWYPLEVGPSPVRGAERFAVKMVGYSMDKTIPPGSDLECLRVAFGSVEPQPGDLVIVARHAHDLTEMTCKRLDREGAEWVLRSESTKPEFQEAIRIGIPDPDAHIDTGVEVIGIVLKSHQQHFRQRAR